MTTEEYMEHLANEEAMRGTVEAKTFRLGVDTCATCGTTGTYDCAACGFGPPDRWLDPCRHTSEPWYSEDDQ